MAGTAKDEDTTHVHMSATVSKAILSNAEQGGPTPEKFDVGSPISSGQGRYCILSDFQSTFFGFGVFSYYICVYINILSVGSGDFC